MPAMLPIEKMTTEDKLRAMEEIWEDLSRASGELVSPSWHADVLKAREKRLRKGESRFEDWATAKEQIRARTQ